MYVTPVTHYHALWLWMPYLLKQCGVTVWESSCSSPFLRMTGKQDWLWQQPLWLCSRFLPPTRLPLFPHPGYVHDVPPQHLSSCSLVGQGEGEVVFGPSFIFRDFWLGEGSLYYFICNVVLLWMIISHISMRQMMLIKTGGWWDVFLIHPFFELRQTISEFRCAPDSQALGTGSGIRRQIPFFNVYVSTVIAFCVITYFRYSKGVHLKWRRLAFYKQLCVFGCLVGFVSKGKP